MSLGHRATKPLGVIRDGDVTGYQVRERLEREVERVDRAHAERVGALHVERARRLRRFRRDEVLNHRGKVPGEHVHAEQNAEASRIAGPRPEPGVLHRERGAQHREQGCAVPELLLLTGQAREVWRDGVQGHFSAVGRG